MTDFSPGNNATEKPPPASLPLLDSQFNTKSHHATKANRNKDEMKEIVVHFDFQHADAPLCSHSVAQIHLHLLYEWQRQFQTIFYNNSNQQIQRIELNDWGPAKYKQEFKVHSKHKNHFIIHRISTRHSLAILKDKVKSILQQHHCRVTHHYWKEDEHDVLKMGHIIGLNPKQYSPGLAQQIVRNAMSANSAGHLMPPFKLVFSTPTITTTNNRTVRTTAYALEIRNQDHAAATKVLSKEPFGNLRILPGQVRRVNPSAYANGLKLQNHHIQNDYIVPVTGITEAMMFHMKPHLQGIPGVRDVFPTRQTQTNGRWNVVVNKALFSSTRDKIEKALPAITAKVAADAMPPAEFAAIPTIPTKKNNAPSIDNLYIQTSAQSFLSINVGSEALDIKSPQTVYGFKSWSEIVQTQQAKPVHLPTAPSTTANTALFEQLDAQKQQIKLMQEQIDKLENLIILLTRKFEPDQPLDLLRQPRSHKLNAPIPTTQKQTSQSDSPPLAADAIMDDTPKRSNLDVSTTPPQEQQSKRQKPTTSPRNLEMPPRSQISLTQYFCCSKAAVVD